MNKRRNSHTHAHTCGSYTTALHRRAVCPACCLLGIIHVWRTDWSPVPQHQLDTFPQVIVTADNERSHAPLGHSEGCQLGSRAVITKLHVYINMTHKTSKHSQRQEKKPYKSPVHLHRRTQWRNKNPALYLGLLSSIIKYELYVHDSKHEVYDSALQNRIQITLCLYLVIHPSSTNESLVLLALWFWEQLNKGKFSPTDTKRLIRTTRSSKPSSDFISVHSYSWKGGLDSCATPQTTNTKKQMGSLGHWTGQNITINIHDNPKRKGDLFHFKLLLLKLSLSYYTVSTLSSVHIVSDVISSI